MKVRHFTATLVFSAMLGSAALAAPEPAPAAPPTTPATAPAAANGAPPAAAPAQDPNLDLNQSVGDWTLRCFKVKSPAPCDMQQITINQQSQQRVMSVSIAYVPSRDTYALQIVVPTGVALAKGMVLGNGNLPNGGLKFSRCERDGCYVELLIDAATITALINSGPKTQVAITAYGKPDQIKLPVSLTGFSEAVDRLKGYSRDRATALPPAAGAPGAQPSAATPAPTKPAGKKK